MTGPFERFAQWRRRRVLAHTPLADEEWDAACAALPFLAGISDDELARLRELSVLFLDAKQMTGAGGLALTNGIRLSIAIQACLPILNLGLEYYAGWVGIVVYPGEFVAPREEHDEDGVVHEYDETIAGEAWEGGPVLLSWEDARHSAADVHEGYNVVIHEFAHKLDMLNGEADGMPPLHAGMDGRAWQAALSAAYADFCRQVDAYDETEDIDEDAFAIDPYAAEHPSEFFAVLSEAFFEIPHVVLAEYPEVYAQFKLFYRQDPATRSPQ
jgi:Mlc titration factor MtfA (ptsG expression regulator)